MLRGLFAAIALLACAGAIRRWRAGNRDVVFGVLAASPAVIVLFQPYGGEASFRAYLFALPWLSFLAAAACRPVAARGGVARVVGALPLLAATAAVTAFMLYVFFGLELANRIDRDDVRASAWYEAHIPAGSTPVYVAPNLPDRLSFRYPSLYPPTGPPKPLLTDERDVAGRLPGPGITRIIARVFRRNGASRGFVVLTMSEMRYARLYGLLPAGSFGQLDRMLGADPAFRLVYSNPEARIWAYRRTAGRGSAHRAGGSAGHP
jgi:hypothetical protein